MTKNERIKKFEELSNSKKKAINNLKKENNRVIKILSLLPETTSEDERLSLIKEASEIQMKHEEEMIAIIEKYFSLVEKIINKS